MRLDRAHSNQRSLLFLLIHAVSLSAGIYISLFWLISQCHFITINALDEMFEPRTYSVNSERRKVVSFTFRFLIKIASLNGICIVSAKRCANFRFTDSIRAIFFHWKATVINFLHFHFAAVNVIFVNIAQRLVRNFNRNREYSGGQKRCDRFPDMK